MTYRECEALDCNRGDLGLIIAAETRTRIVARYDLDAWLLNTLRLTSLYVVHSLLDG